jgi:hypothetical protein
VAAHAIIAALNLDPRPPPVRLSLFGVGDVAILAEDSLFGYIVAVGWPVSTLTSSMSSSSGSGTHTPTSSQSSASDPSSISATDLFKDRANEKLDALPNPIYILDRMLYSSTASLTIVPEKALLKPCASRGETLRAFPKEFKKVFPSFECVEIGVRKRPCDTGGMQLQYEYLIEARWGADGEGKQEWVGAKEMEMLRGMG